MIHTVLLKTIPVRVAASLLTLIVAMFVSACTTTGSTTAPQAKPIDTAAKVEKIVAVIEAQMAAPAEKRIAAALLSNAQCIVVIPEMIQGGVGVGLKHGSGIMSCRHNDGNTWGVPAFVRLSGASIGTQLGIQKVDVMMLAMTDNGLNQLLAAKPIASGDAGVTIGPIGRNAEIALDVLLQTPLLSYTRSTGMYAGATLGGSVFTIARKTNTGVYGQFDDARQLLLERTEVPVEVQPLVDLLNRYAPTEEQ